jgi:hypothetical protein
LSSSALEKEKEKIQQLANEAEKSALRQKEKEIGLKSQAEELHH